MVEVQIIEDLQAPLHAGEGRLPEWLRTKRVLLALDKYDEELCIFRCIAVHQGAHRVRNTRKTRELAASIFDKNRVRGQIYKRHFPFIENHFQQGIAGYEIDAEGAFALKYLPSRFDKMRVPQMDIGIYEEHALLITKPDKVTKHYVCAECQARFTKACHLLRHAEVCTRGVSKVVCRRERIQPPETAYEKAFYGHREYAGKVVSWMEHEAQRRGVHIHHHMCGQAGERRIAGYPGDGFCWETNEVFQFHGCHWHGWPECFPGRRKEVVAFEKTKQGRRGLTREMQFARTLDRRRAILDEGFELIECWEHDFKERPLYPKKKKDTFPHAIVFDVGARRCWTRANASRRSRICSSKASTYRCLFRWQTIWIERQSTSAAKIPKS